MSTSNIVWLNTSDLCTLEHLLTVSGLRRQELLELVNAGVITPAKQDTKNWLFQTECIVVARQARRLRQDFDLTIEGLGLAMNLMRRIRRLEDELDQLQARTPRL